MGTEIDDKDIILTINVVEPPLVRAVGLLSQSLKRKLHGLVLVHADYAKLENRPKDHTGLFTEIVCDFNDPDELQRVLKPYAERILAATCRYEEALQPFSQVIPFLPYIPTPSETSLFWSTEKPLMRDRLSNYDKNLTPKYRYVGLEDVAHIASIVKDFSFPVIVKPAGLAKSLLVTRCETVAELKTALKRSFQIIYDIYEREQYPGKPGVLVEEMMQGQMYSVDAYTMGDGETFCLPVVKVVTAHSLSLPGFYSYEVIVPVDLSDKEVAGAHQACRDAIKALNLRNTTSHIELFRTPTGWKIIEVAARIGGHRDDLYREVYGIEHFVNDLNIHMGNKPQMPGEPRKHALALNMYAETEGEIAAISGVQQARQLESVVYLKVHAQPGNYALFATNGGNPVIDAVLSNKDAKRLQADLKRLRELVNIEVKPAQALNYALPGF